MEGRFILQLAFILGLTTGLGIGQMIEDTISPVSYHVCERTVTVNVSKVVPFQKPVHDKSLCMGWIPWKLCSRTSYVTEYRTIWVPDTVVVTECCDGYELLGHYCAMSTKNARVTNTRPGECPAKMDEGVLCPECIVDYDCPGFQKCCDTSTGSYCMSPEPPALDRNTIKFWYNGTITIKMKYYDLIELDPGYANHTRLLHAMVTGELWPLEVELYHISTLPAGPFTITSHILIGINESLSLQDIAMSLSNIVVRLPEVIDVQISDLDECLHHDLGACPPLHHCINTEGSYSCSILNSTNHQPPLGQDCSTFLSHNISNVTTSGFHIEWSTDCPDSHIYTIQISSSMGINRSEIVSKTSVNISGLNAGELYTVLVTFTDSSGGIHSLVERVKTKGQILNGTLKINNWNLTGPLLDQKSPEYADFVNKFISEVKRSLSGHIPPDLVSVQILSLSPGSIVATFLIIINDTKKYINATAASLASINESSVFKVDPQSIKLADFNECLSPSDNDCDIYAICKNLEGSFTCECQPTYIDRDPSRPGRKCEGGTYSTISIDTSPPTTASTIGPTTKVTTQSSTELHYPTPPKDHLMSTFSVLDIQQTGQFASTVTVTNPNLMEVNATMYANHTAVNSSPSDKETTTFSSTTHSTTGPMVNSSTSDEESTTLASTIRLKTGPMVNSSTSDKESPTLASTMHSITNPMINSSISHENSTTLTSTTHSTTGPMVNSSISNRESTTLTSTTHSTTHPMINSSTDDKGIIIPASTTMKLTTTPEIPCPTSLVSMNLYAESTNTPLLALQTKTTPRTPSMTLRDAIKVVCESGKIGISIEKAFLRMMSISSHSLFLGSPECSVNCSTDTHVIIQAGWNNCNTDVFSNNTHTVVNTTLYIDLSTSMKNITPGAVSLIRCVFQNNILWSSGYNPAGGFYTIIEKIEAGGSFFPEFQLFIGDQLIPPNFTLSATDDITVQIRIRTDQSQFKVVINECWATPTEDAYDPMSFPFIQNSCALANTFTTILMNGVSSNATFQTKIFSFVNNPIVYLHCRLSVCQEESPNSCKPLCSNFRASVSNADKNVFTGVTRMGPLRMASQSQDSNASSNGTLGPGYIILIAISVLAVIAIIIAILVCWHQRRTGNYNFKLKTRDVGYQVFSS
ncbi:uromodulin-like 1 [Pyxicephalus adspersus]|uniref:uromodulin-like 1 n=1 Tax=Pyxicephalus adspersus TaxID=30357 RepID=UPI003B59F22D